MTSGPDLGTNCLLAGPVAQSGVTKVSRIADPRVMSLILARSQLLSWRLIMKYVLLSFSASADSRRAVVSYKLKYVRFDLPRKKVCVGC